MSGPPVSACGEKDITTIRSLPSRALDLDVVSGAARDLNVIRQRRHGAVYDWEAVTRERDVTALRSAAMRLLHHGRAWLEATRPRLRLPDVG